MDLKQPLCYPIVNVPAHQRRELFAAAAEIGYAAVTLWDAPDDLD